jgi:ribonuclease III
MQLLRAETLETVLGYRFRNHELMERALTHKSRAYERGADPVPSDNEQLEFLGDSILGFVVSEELVVLYPSSPEGRLSKLKAHLVSASHLFQVAHALKLGEFLLLGRGEEMSGGREKKALLANAMEALIAAIYLDGGIDPARHFVTKNIFGEFHSAEQTLGALPDFKSALQEMAQSLKLPQPRYTILEERGPQHAKTFVVEARVGREWASQAEGLSKKSAGQKAAQDVLRQLRELSGPD